MSAHERLASSQPATKTRPARRHTPIITEETGVTSRSTKWVSTRPLLLPAIPTLEALARTADQLRRRPTRYGTEQSDPLIPLAWTAVLAATHTGGQLPAPTHITDINIVSAPNCENGHSYQALIHITWAQPVQGPVTIPTGGRTKTVHNVTFRPAQPSQRTR